MNILYLACHSILEYDELKIFHELGYDFFSLGGYVNPRVPHDPKRPAIDHDYHEHLASIAQVHNSYNLHEEQVKWADVVIAMHIPEFIEKNWPLFKKLNKRVIWRSIGQSVEAVEQRLKPYRDEGMEVVRYSPAEVRIPNNIGHDAIIRFGKDPDEFNQWDGSEKELITFSQNMQGRGKYCNYDTFKTISNGLNAHIYGPTNEQSGELNGGMLSYEELKGKMQQARVYFYGGTHPAPYTLNFIEALMTGIPIVAVGNMLGNSPDFNQDTYEIPELIVNGVHGFYSDNTDQLKSFVNSLLENDGLAKQISRQGRQKALELFDVKLTKKQWRTYLEK